MAKKAHKSISILKKKKKNESIWIPAIGFHIYNIHCISVSVSYYTCMNLFLFFFSYGCWGQWITDTSVNTKYRTIHISNESTRLHHSNGKNAFAVTFPICLTFVMFVCLLLWLRFVYWINFTNNIIIWCLLAGSQHNTMEIFTKKLRMNHPFVVITCLQFYNFFEFT